MGVYGKIYNWSISYRYILLLTHFYITTIAIHHRFNEYAIILPSGRYVRVLERQGESIIVVCQGRIIVKITEYHFKDFSPNTVGGDELAEMMMRRRLPQEIVKGVKQMPITEELALEHGMLNRILLVLNNMIMAPDSGPRPNLNIFTMACAIMKQLVDLRHMSYEEESIYPLYDNDPEMGDIIRTLRAQHAEGRKFVDRMNTISRSGTPSPQAIEELKRDFVSFQTMMTAHAGFEETILFPYMMGTLSDEQMKDLKMKGIKQEESLMGPNATQKAYDMLVDLENAASVSGPEFYTKKAL